MVINNSVSVDDRMELGKIGYLPWIRDRQYPESTVVPDYPSATYEHSVDVFGTHTYCLQDVCRNWCTGFLAQRLGSIFQKSASEICSKSPYRYKLRHG